MQLRTLCLLALLLSLAAATNNSTQSNSTTTTTTTETSYSSTGVIDGTLGTLKVILPLLRNLILLGAIFNLSDAFLPWIIFSESLLLLGLWPERKHQLDDFFKGALNSKIDIMGAMRQSMSGQITADTPEIFAQAGFVNNAFLNLSGEFIWVIIFLALTVLIKMAGSFCRNERARRFASKLRCRWNGFFMGVLPRVATLSTLHISAGGAGNIVMSVILLILILAFWIQLFIHLRWVVAKPDNMADRSRRVGLLGRIQLRDKFEFDCLEWSNVYFPLMNYTRLLLYFLVLGVGPSSVYFAYAGPILSQLIILMIEVSSPGYDKRRDRVLYPIQNFLLMLAHIAIIVVVLGQSVSQEKACIIGQSVLSAFLLIIFIPLAVQLVLDTVREARDRWSVPKEDQSLQIEPQQTFHNQPTEKVEDVSSLAFTKSTVNPKLKIKKVKRGRVI